ncbi:c-type cytochrome [Sphingobium sp. WCS2017Hpa-17]|uniref:c-type cytochrome n=1 Tax=Sphingobium sp. WCS2017Hpa-17 TaxID=3073638 RepID=UPI00288A31D7|nr:c-type cytochrome [Sphingobium sp. WCS2017Hpa-17]
MIRRWSGWIALLVAIVALTLWVTARPVNEARSRPTLPRNADPASRGAAAFLGAGFGGISVEAMQSNAVPWRLVAAALLMEEQRRDPKAKLDQATLRRILQRFGFLYPDRVANLPKGVMLHANDMPLGMTWGDIAPIGGSHVQIANLGCAACHAGVSYDADGQPVPRIALLGMPNSSLDLEAYTDAVYQALRRHADSPALLEAVKHLFPDMGWREEASLRWIILPLSRHRLATLVPMGRATPFHNGAPGSTNGVAALKRALSVPLVGGGAGDTGVVSIPDLGQRFRRTSLLVDGAYRIAERPDRPTHGEELDARHLNGLAAITSFFTVPSMGVHPDDARAAIDDARDIFAFLKDYQAQPFPGPINRTAARHGATIYAQQCAACHGDYGWTGAQPVLQRFPNWIGQVGTDRLRADVFDEPLAKAIGKTRYRGLIAVQPGRGYAAPPLAGLWASAPYLHNGSVPTLAALLSPAERPRRFMVGGHALDWDRLGLRLTPDGRYPAGYVPFSQPQWIDTDETGRGRNGHLQGTTLSVADKRALIEFLKLL